MKMKWKGEYLAEFDMDEGLTVQEMIRVKRELGKEYGNQRIFMSAAMDLTKKVPQYDLDGKPVLDADGNPVMRTEASAEWDPEAWAFFVVLLHARAGKTIFIEDVDGVMSDLDADLGQGEIEKIAAEMGKAPAEVEAMLHGEDETTETSSTGSGDTQPDFTPASA